MDELLDQMNDFKVNENTDYSKHLEIVRESLLNKKVELLPGVDNNIKKNFENVGCTYIENVLGFYLIFQRNDYDFKSWLYNECLINDLRIQNMICDCIKEWCMLNL